MVKYYAPGERRKNQTYIVRGSVQGHEVELRTEATTKRAAEREWAAHVKEIKANPRSRLAAATFGELADAYVDARQPSANDRRYIERLRQAFVKHRDAKFEELSIDDIQQLDIFAAAHNAYPTARNETKNRQAITPAATVLHFAADNNVIPWQRVNKLPSGEPETRRPNADGVRKLLEKAESDQRDFLVFLFAQGWRVSEALSLKWCHVDLQRRKLTVYVGKSKRWKEVAMHAEVFEILANRPILDDETPVWPWKSRWRVYDWLTPLRKRAKIFGTYRDFTPHKARHEWGSQQNDAGGTDVDAVHGSTWTSTKSVKRYQTPSQEQGQRIASRINVGQFQGKKR